MTCVPSTYLHWIFVCTFCARWRCRLSPGHWISVVLLSCGATGQPFHSSLWLPLFSADKWLSQPSLIRAFLPIHQLSIPGFTLAAQKGRQKQRWWLTGQIYQHSLLTQINKNSPTSKAVLSHFSHHFLSWDSVSTEKLKKPGSSFDRLFALQAQKEKKQMNNWKQQHWQRFTFRLLSAYVALLVSP